MQGKEIAPDFLAEAQAADDGEDAESGSIDAEPVGDAFAARRFDGGDPTLTAPCEEVADAPSGNLMACPEPEPRA